MLCCCSGVKSKGIHLTEIIIKLWVINGQNFVDVSIFEVELRYWMHLRLGSNKIKHNFSCASRWDTTRRKRSHSADANRRGGWDDGATRVLRTGRQCPSHAGLVTCRRAPNRLQSRWRCADALQHPAVVCRAIRVYCSDAGGRSCNWNGDSDR